MKTMADYTCPTEKLKEYIVELIQCKGSVTFTHPVYKKFHNEIIDFVIKNDFSDTVEWGKIQSNLLIKPTQYMVIEEANIILENLEKLKIQYLKRNHKQNKYLIFFEKMHPMIRNTSEKKFFDGHYADSVESAFKEIDSRLKKLYLKHKEKDLTGKSLMLHIFNLENKSNQRLLAFNKLDTQSEKNVQEGFMNIFAGAMQAIRNPKSHANLDITQDDAVDKLMLASMLMKKIDEAISFSKIEENINCIPPLSIPGVFQAPAERI